MLELIHDETIRYFKETITNATEEQINFASKVTKLLLNDKDTSKVNIVPAPCGFGKSILIRSYMKASVTYAGFNTDPKEYKGNGFVIVTDLFERFNKFDNDPILKESTYLMKYDEQGENFIQQVKEQYNYPILLMSTQKYFKLNNSEREFIFTWKNGERKTVIFDEKPYFYNSIEIDDKFINNIDTEIGDIKETNDKDFMKAEIYSLREYLDREKAILARKSDKSIYIYWRGSRQHLSTDDDRFFKLANKYLPLDTRKNLKIIKYILKNGAIFVNKKNENLKDNRRYFFIIKDNKKEFYLNKDKAKFWIFDATADDGVDVEYNRDYINRIPIKYNKNYKVKIENINISTSKNALRNKDQNKIIQKYIYKNYNIQDFILTHKDYNKLYKNKFKNSSYFNGIKGSNEYKDVTKMAQIGLNRYSDIAYLQIYLSLNFSKYEHMKNNIIESENILNELLEMKSGNFTNIEMNKIMYSKLLVDIEQNIFRTKLRDYSNKDEIKIDLIYNSDTFEKLNEILQNRLNVDVAISTPIEIIENKIDSRKNKKESNSQRIKRWFRENEGRGETSINDILNNCNLTKKQLDKAKEKNSNFKLWLKDRKIKKGIYDV